MNYSVIQIRNKQYKVEKGDEILVDKLTDEKIEAQLLLHVTDKKKLIGKPFIDGAKVKLQKMADEQGDKIYVQKYKAKSRYRRKIGFRPKFTRVKIVSISP